MSVESAKAFSEKFNADEAFRKSFEGAADDEAKKKIAKDAGFDFTKDEIKVVLSEKKGQLSEAELESVAGGTSGTWVAVGIGAAAAAA
jgi:predicted ribosomally synthesized peptide with nif11-like leader